MNIIGKLADWKRRLLDRLGLKKPREKKKDGILKEPDDIHPYRDCTGGLAPTAWDDMELEESISFANLSEPEQPRDGAIEYNPLYPESADELLPSEAQDAPRETRGFSDEVIIMTRKPKDKKAPLLPNYLNM